MVSERMSFMKVGSTRCRVEEEVDRRVETQYMHLLDSVVLYAIAH